MIHRLNLTVLHPIILFAFLSTSFAQNPDWINYTSGDDVNTLADDGEYLWVGTTVGLVKINKTSGETDFYTKDNSGLPANNIISLAVDSSGNKWIGVEHLDGWEASTSMGILSFDGVNWTLYDESNSELPDALVTSIAIDGNGTKWIGTRFDGLASFDGTTWAVYNESNSGLPTNKVSSIAIDANGNKWIGTIHNGLTVFNAGGIVGINDYLQDNTLATDFILQQNYPNPFNPITTIQYELPQRSYVQITIYDLLGYEVATLVSEIQDAGYKSIQWNASTVPSGMYFYQIKAGEYVQTRKMLLIK